MSTQPFTWIKVSDSLPPLDQAVLTWDGELVIEIMTRSEMNKPYCWVSEGGLFEPDTVTHWGALPSPPEA